MGESVFWLMANFLRYGTSWRLPQDVKWVLDVRFAALLASTYHALSL